MDRINQKITEMAEITRWKFPKGRFESLARELGVTARSIQKRAEDFRRSEVVRALVRAAWTEGQDPLRFMPYTLRYWAERFCRNLDDLRHEAQQEADRVWDRVHLAQRYLKACDYLPKTADVELMALVMGVPPRVMWRAIQGEQMKMGKKDRDTWPAGFEHWYHYSFERDVQEVPGSRDGPVFSCRQVLEDWL